ncbi:MAG: hypothetical protein JHC93_08530, partial [Parachlamydiales bacterium]|nr:hypothetical protein [Parachlamydiales bacterium]
KDDKISSQFSSQSSTPTIERVAPYFVESSSEESIVPAATTPKVVSPVISPAQSDTKVVAPVIESLQPYIKTVEPLTAAVTDPLLNKFSVPSFVLPTAPVIQPNIEKIVPYVNPLADKTSSAPKTVIGMEDYNVGEASSNEFVPNTIVDKELEELEELERQAIADSLREFKYSQPNLPSGSSILPKKPSLKTEVTSDETIIPEGKQEVTPLTEPISLADQELLDMEKAIALSLQDDPTNKVLDKIASLTNDSKPSVKPEPSVFNLEKLGEGKSLDSAQKQWSNPVTNEDKITYKTRFDNYNKIKSYSESNKINLAFREVKGDGNCGISSFLLTLFNKLSRSELITEFKHYTNTGIDPVKYEKVLAKYKKLSISAFSTFKNLENDPSKTIDDNSIKILSHWLRFRILVESLICHNDPVKKSSSEFFATEHNMRDFVDNFFNDPKNKNVKKVKSLLANFSVAISTLDNPINIEHLMLLGSSFNHSVTVFNIDGIGDNAIIKYNTIPGKDLHLVLKGGNQDSAHFDALLKR